MKINKIYNAWRVDLDFNPVDDVIRVFVSFKQSNVIKLLATEAGICLDKCLKSFVPLSDGTRWFVTFYRVKE